MTNNLFGVPDVPPELTSPDPEETLTYDQKTATIYENLDNPVKVSATLDGSPWKVTFYNQILGEDDVPRQLDLGLDPSLQQYVSIKKYVLGVTGDIQPGTYDSSTGITTITGSAQVYPGVSVNVGDMFVGTQKDRRLGLFRVTSVERLQYIAGSALEIEYRLFDYYTPTYEANLNSKVVKSYFFDESKVSCGKSLVDESRSRDIGLTLKELVNWYYDLFYDLKTETFIWPYKPYDDVPAISVYDHFATAFFKALLDYDLRGLNPQATIYSCLNGEYRDNSITIWDTLMTGNLRSLTLIKQNASVLSPMLFQTDRMFNSITTSSIDNVMWPGGHPTLLSRNRDDLGEPYVFSKAFYQKDDTNTSIIEKSVATLLEGGTLDPEYLDTVISDLNTASLHTLFHAIPIVVWILKAYSR